MSTFSPIFNVHSKCCGPDLNDPQTISSGLAAFQKFPFEATLKQETLGKVCDFTFATYQRNLRDSARWGYGGGGSLSAVGGGVGDPSGGGEFHLLATDSRAVGRTRGHWNRRKVPKESTEAYNQKQQDEVALQLGKKTRAEQKKQQAAQKARQQRMTARHKTFSEWSVEPTPEWTVVANIPFSALAKLKVETAAITVKDVRWCGTLLYYNKLADRISPKATVPLQNFHDTDFYVVTSKADDIIKDILLDNQLDVTVAATAQVLACLMSTAHSRYSWHLIITKMENKVIIDKADGSIVDFLTVNETAQEPPAQDAEIRMNRPPALGMEAMRINQNFSQHVLTREEKPAKVQPNAPFVEPEDNPAAVAYRYRIFTIPGNPNHTTRFGRQSFKLITRAEVNAKLPNSEDDSYVCLCTVNEYDLKSQKPWRTQLENQQGALLATEIRNNGNRLHKCVAAAIIAGCDVLKMGFVSRRNANDNENHTLLLVQSLKTLELGTQIGLKMKNAWGIVRAIVDMAMEQPDGVYILLKDPTKQFLRLYVQPGEDEDEDASNAMGFRE